MMCYMFWHIKLLYCLKIVAKTYNEELSQLCKS